MRQAGRYLPEYRVLRAEKGGFLALVNDSDAAAEVTLQPIRRFGFDGAILFSDILIVPFALGQDLRFEAGEGPRLSPPLADALLGGVEAVQLFDSWSGSLAPAQFESWVIAPTARIVAALKERHPETPIIGFPKGAGAKLAAYARETGVDALGLDETVDPAWAASVLPS